MRMIFDALEWDDDENDPSGVNEPMVEMKMQVSPAQMRAKQSLIGWLAAEPIIVSTMLQCVRRN